MRNLGAVLLTLIFVEKAGSQVIFSPKGAEWQYIFYNGDFDFKEIEGIKYARDSIVGGDTAKVLLSQRFFNSNNFHKTDKTTLIKQNGDTVFMRNAITQHTWQILYNYAAVAGQAWNTNVYLFDQNQMPTILSTYTVSVDSINYTVINSTNLKRLFVKYSYYKNDSLNPAITIFKSDTAIIMERLGCNKFMFNYHNLLWTLHEDYFVGSFCYSDNTMPITELMGFPCGYIQSEDNVSVKLNEFKPQDFKIYPNPTSDKINFNLIKYFGTTCNLKIINGLGQLVANIQSINTNSNLSMAAYLEGVYLFVFYNNQTQKTFKVVKQ